MSEWQQLAHDTRIPLAAGENLMGRDAFESMIVSQALGVVQPDLAKWGGVSGCLPVVEAILDAGLRYCPHFLGAGVGMLASAHALAARGSQHGMLEIDANENLLRTMLSPVLGVVSDGAVHLGSAPGIGIDPDIAALRSFCERRR